MLFSFSPSHDQHSLRSVSLKLYICALRVACPVRRSIHILNFCLFMVRSSFTLLCKSWFISNLNRRHISYWSFNLLSASTSNSFLIMFLPTTKRTYLPQSLFWQAYPPSRYIPMSEEPGQSNIIVSFIQFYRIFAVPNHRSFRSGFSKHRYNCSAIRIDVYVSFLPLLQQRSGILRTLEWPVLQLERLQLGHGNVFPMIHIRPIEPHTKVSVCF